MNSTEETEKTFKGLERNFNGKFFQNNNDNDNSNLGRPTDILNFPNYVILVRTRVCCVNLHDFSTEACAGEEDTIASRYFDRSHIRTSETTQTNWAKSADYFHHSGIFF